MKQKIEDLKCYPSLCQVMGVTQAKCELFKVAENAGSFNDYLRIIESFTFEETQQGSDFWWEIKEKQDKALSIQP